MNWIEIRTEEELKDAVRQSFEKKVLLFKHSIRCGTSSRALSLLEMQWKDNEMTDVETYFIDVVRHRKISNDVAKEFNVRHQSPQVLIIADGECIYNDSHGYIMYEYMKPFLVTQ